jgi:hypothetical protein
LAHSLDVFLNKIYKTFGKLTYCHVVYNIFGGRQFHRVLHKCRHQCIKKLFRCIIIHPILFILFTFHFSQFAHHTFEQFPLFLFHLHAFLWVIKYFDCFLKCLDLKRASVKHDPPQESALHRHIRVHTQYIDEERPRVEVKVIWVVHLQFQALLADQAVHTEVECVCESLTQLLGDEGGLEASGDFCEELDYCIGQLEMCLSLSFVLVKLGSHLLLLFLVELAPIG